MTAYISATTTHIVLPESDHTKDSVESFHVKIVSRTSADNDASLTAANGAMPQGLRGSPGPQVPNGKPTGPPGGQAMSPTLNEGSHSVSSKDPKAAAAAALDNKNIVRRKLTGFVGFANLPNQWHRKSVRKGFNFNVMVVGEWAR